MLHFLIGFLIVGIIIIMMVRSRIFRNFVLAILILAAGGIWLLIENDNKNAEKRKQIEQAQEHYATTAIREADLKLDDVRLSGARYPSGEFILSGTVVNDSNSPLAMIYFQVTFTDCQDSVCRIVGQKDASASVVVPPKQMRSFDSYGIKFDNLPAVGSAKRSWSYRIAGIRAG